ncbi:S41 family peptidase [uncultured Acetobacteroides sp.]|uniref:S41 family peptidase n=1 Tax=uncultured Acetobacteroides sp. TaxID=1760811 RepID=UPI0029F5C1C7|nr:S41 family peptidase [uncultured Acetobacteroides sp.]
MSYDNKKRDILLPILIASALIVGVLIGLQLRENDIKRSRLFSSKSDKLNAIMNYIEEEYVDTISRDSLVEKTIPLMMANLDPHSVYIPAKEIEAVNESLDGEFSGIGVEFNMPSDTVVVLNTVPGGPSEKVGIKSGDRIVRINDTTIAGVKFPQGKIMKRLRGKTGTKVNVSVKRRGVAQLIKFTIVRDVIPVKSVDVAYMIEPKVGYIKVSKFARDTYKEFDEAINKLHNQGMKKVIVDLRGNTGGYLDQAVEIVNEFLPENKLIVYTQGKARPRQNLYSDARGGAKSDELVILIDEESASASEIMAGAIQDNDRGTIVGRRSFGKGLVQEQASLTDGSAIRLTVARYYTPTGRSIQKPYKLGDGADYYMDLSNRYIHGEMANSDSIKLNTKLRYKTPKGKIVYGGGGIMPDIFVPLDTVGLGKFYKKVYEQSLIFKFTAAFSDIHRQELNKITKIGQLKQYLTGQNLMGQFIAYCAKSGVYPEGRDLKHSYKLIDAQLKAFVGRNTPLNDEGFYPFIESIDNVLNRAVNEFHKRRR